MSYRFFVTSLSVIAVASVVACAPAKRAAQVKSSTDTKATVNSASATASKSTVPGRDTAKTSFQGSLPKGAQTSASIGDIKTISDVHTVVLSPDAKSVDSSEGLMFVITDSNKKEIHVSIESKAVEADAIAKGTSADSAPSIKTDAVSAAYECLVAGQAVKDCENLTLKVAAMSTSKTMSEITVARKLNKNRLVTRDFLKETNAFGNAEVEVNQLTLNQNLSGRADSNGQSKIFETILIAGQDASKTASIMGQRRERGSVVLTSKVSGLENKAADGKDISYEEQEQSPVIQEQQGNIQIVLNAVTAAGKESMTLNVDLTKEATAVPVNVTASAPAPAGEPKVVTLPTVTITGKKMTDAEKAASLTEEEKEKENRRTAADIQAEIDRIEH